MHGDDAILYGEQPRIPSQYFVFLYLKTFDPFAEIWIIFPRKKNTVDIFAKGGLTVTMKHSSPLLM